MEIIDQGESLETLVNQLLVISESEAEQLRLDREPIAFDETVCRSAEMFAGVAESRNIEMKTRISAPVRIRGNGHLLKQLVNNLIDNAIKYTPPGGRVAIEGMRGNETKQPEQVHVEAPGCSQGKLAGRSAKRSGCIILDDGGGRNRSGPISAQLTDVPRKLGTGPFQPPSSPSSTGTGRGFSRRFSVRGEGSGRSSRGASPVRGLRDSRSGARSLGRRAGFSVASGWLSRASPDATAKIGICPPVSFSTLSIASTSSGATRVNARPLAPARPVRPTRWT